MESAVIIVSRDEMGKRLQKLIGGVNPESKNLYLSVFAKMTNEMTTNELIQIVRVNKFDITNSDVEGDD